MNEVVNVLAVDDVAENLVALSMLLKRPGLRLIEARSGNEALEVLLKEDIALALLDVNMPGMDGFELAELMRGSDRTKHVPIIFLTATVPDRMRVFKGYEAGAVDFLFKPIEPHLLVSKVEVFAQLDRQRRQLAEQLDQLQQAQGMSDLFVGVLGHDLRNPLNSIVMSATLLEQTPTDPDLVRHRARIVQRGADRMNRLIQQVLDFALARLKDGIPVTLAEVDLSKVAWQAVAELDSPEGPRIRTEILGDPSGSWDPDRVMQVVSNLVANALHYGDSGVPVHVRVDGTDTRSVLLEVRNGGVMSPETLRRLFSPFKPRERNSRGIGLGLYIVDQIIRAHRGSIHVDSSEVLGTVVRVRLPRRAADRALSA